MALEKKKYETESSSS